MNMRRTYFTLLCAIALIKMNVYGADPEWIKKIGSIHIRESTIQKYFEDHAFKPLPSLLKGLKNPIQSEEWESLSNLDPLVLSLTSSSQNIIIKSLNRLNQRLKRNGLLNLIVVNQGGFAIGALRKPSLIYYNDQPAFTKTLKTGEVQVWESGFKVLYNKPIYESTHPIRVDNRIVGVLWGIWDAAYTPPETDSQAPSLLQNPSLLTIPNLSTPQSKDNLSSKEELPKFSQPSNEKKDNVLVNP